MKTEEQVKKEIDLLNEQADQLLNDSFALKAEGLTAMAGRKLRQMYKIEDHIKVLLWVLSDDVEGMNDPDGDY